MKERLSIQIWMLIGDAASSSGASAEETAPVRSRMAESQAEIVEEELDPFFQGPKQRVKITTCMVMVINGNSHCAWA
jgi:hypothetical protein